MTVTKPTSFLTLEDPKATYTLSRMPWSLVRSLKCLNVNLFDRKIVMLRLLEYFSGILIMTTNRVRSIDYAIMSRISYAIKFPALPVKYQQAIYQGFVEQARKKPGVINEAEVKKLKKLAERIKPKENLNGRDIRTMFTTAQLRGNGKLTSDAMEEIYEQQTSFKDDMNALYIIAENTSVVK